MKKTFALFVAVCLAVMPFLQSCDDGEGYSLGDFTPPLWATVRTTGASFYLDCDVWGTLWPVNLDLGWYVPIDGRRVITSFNPLWDNYEGYDHAVKILTIQDVLTKSVETLTPETEEEFGNDPVYIAEGDISISNGYMNVYFQQNLPKETKHRISLVRPESDDDLYGADGYIHLQIRYNNYDDLTGVYTQGVVSYNLNSLNIKDDTKGIKVTVNSEKAADEVEFTFDIVSSESNAERLANQDLSKMQIR